MGKRDLLKLKADKAGEENKTAPVQEFEQGLMFNSPLASNNVSSTSVQTNTRPPSVSSARYAASIVASLRPSQRYVGAQPLEVINHKVMIHYIYQQQGNNGWRSEEDTRSEGVIMRLSGDKYLYHQSH
jgi:hypothetical protein